MKLVTFQSMKALKDLISKGYLECNNNIDLKNKKIYDYIVSKMNEKLDNKYNTKYPLWCWVKCYNGICPPKIKGKKVDGFDVKITFNKNEKDVFITDFRRYSFLLNNKFIPNNINELNKVNNELKKYNITDKELLDYIRNKENIRSDKDFIKMCKKIENSFDRCITNDSNILQGCIWRINLNEIESIEILKDDGYIYGSLNYIRSNGKRMNWINDYYKKLEVEYDRD